MGRTRDPITGRFVQILEPPAQEAPVSNIDLSKPEEPAVGDLVSFTLHDQVSGTSTPGVGLVVRGAESPGTDPVTRDPLPATLRVIPLPGLGVEVAPVDVAALADAAV